jgi:hypothetical protein
MDVDRNILRNEDAPGLLSPQGALFGLNTEQGNANNIVPLYSSIPQRIPLLGSWYAVPDNMFVYRETGFGLRSGRIVWKLPVRYGRASEIVFYNGDDIKYDLATWRSPFKTEHPIENVSVRVTTRTVPGLVASNLITQATADAILARDIRSGELNEDGSLPDTTGLADNLLNAGNNAANTAKTGFTAVIVVALVVAAIYFVPRKVVA